MQYDIIIVGGGIVGGTLACALAKHSSLSIALLEAKPTLSTWSPDVYHHRVSAISLSSIRIFKAIGIWQTLVQKRISPFKKMYVWDEMSDGEITFDSQDIATTNLGYIIENQLIEQVLHEKLQSYSSQIDIFSGTTIEDIVQARDHLIAKLSDKKELSTQLLIGADGAKSFVREKANIAFDRYDYEQVAIVATVKTTKAHDEIARQVFLASGPLAFLPFAIVN